MGFEEFFPYNYRPQQKEVMQEIYDALFNEQIYLLEGACGTGKTISALAPALAAAKNLNKLVVIATNVNEQKSQFVDETRVVKGISNINVIVMSSKTKMCYYNQNLESEKEKISYEQCKNKRDSNDCEPYNKTKDEEVQRDFYQWVFGTVRRPEELIEWGRKNKACVYSLMWKALAATDLIICDVSMFLDRRFLNIFQKFTNKSLNDTIIVFDEAHNIEKVAKEKYTKTLSEQRLEWGIGELSKVIDEMDEYRNSLMKRDNLLSSAVEGAVRYRFKVDENQLKELRWFIKDVLLKAMQDIKISNEDKQKTTNQYDGSEISIADPKIPYYDRPSDVFTQNIMKAINGNTDEVKDILYQLTIFGLWYEEIYFGDEEHKQSSNCTIISDFINYYLNEMPYKNGYFPYLNIKKNNYGEIRKRLNIHLSLPEFITAPVLNEMYSGVLMSATLQPFQILKSVLGIEREIVTKTVGLLYPRKNRRTYVVRRDTRNDNLWNRDQFPKPPDVLVSKNKENPASIKYIKDSLEAIIDGSDGNILIFFKTIEQATEYFSILYKKYGTRVLLNATSVTAGATKNIFFEMGENEKKSILCTYLGGSLT
ncbi:MAG: DEAD/DEAH box helicase family protein, partial [Nitrospirota bacterium]|nr:DEAD/DEAH box helicase family protein [Nitrospirota bacterium]